MRLDDARIVEVGCGTGYWIRELIGWGARPEHTIGLDLQLDRLKTARRSSAPRVGWLCGSASEIGLASDSVDVVLQATVFTSILDESVRTSAAREMIRIVRPGGLILWYDFLVNNPWNPDVRGVDGAEIRRLFHDCVVKLKRITLAPPLARRLVRVSWVACSLMERLPALCTHYVGVIQKPEA
jgi:ubiquinone/menaquinone biosynthesis C-methylase UbiE